MARPHHTATTKRMGEEAGRRGGGGGGGSGGGTALQAVGRLTLLFGAWKVLLAAVVLATPGVLGGGYDSSGELWWATESSNISDSETMTLRWCWRRLLVRLTRWDAIYFANIAKKGYVLEQEWAFGWGWTRLMSWAGTRGCRLFECIDDTESIVSAGVILANAAHLLSVLVLYGLTRTVTRNERVAFVAAALHVLSPAGVFLVAPYTEAVFSLLAFTGLWAYALGFLSQARGSRVLGMGTAGLLFGLSAMVRGNGLLFGSIFAYDVVVIVAACLAPLVSSRGAAFVAAGFVGGGAFLVQKREGLVEAGVMLWQAADTGRLFHSGDGVSGFLAGVDWHLHTLDFAGFLQSVGIFSIAAVPGVLLCGIICALYVLGNIPSVKRDAEHVLLIDIVSAVVGGAFTLTGYVWPQALAYRDFCTGSASSSGRPPWCKDLPPSVFTSVQNRYWNVGLFKYWTLSNAPLFALAAPMLAVLFISGTTALLRVSSRSSSTAPLSTPSTAKSSSSSSAAATESRTQSLARRLAIPQLVLAGLAATTFHVQIVNRIATGYPLWYIFLAERIVAGPKPKGASRGRGWTRLAVRAMVCYALVQAVLFTAFLPPA